jgi:sterol desaturase/sphingolipid hydroxylase (fatty acid hydroxylase superfamily)
MSLFQALLAQMPEFAVQVLRLLIWLVLLSTIFIPLERFFALRSCKRSFTETSQDLAYYFLSSLLPMLLLGTPLAILAVAANEVLPEAYLTAISALPTAARLILIFVIGEIGFYWGHRLSHEIPCLWRFHSIHHGPEHLYYLANTRAHPVDLVVTRLFGLGPLYALGLAGPGTGANAAPVMLILVGTLWGFFVHSNLRLRMGPFEWLLSTPAFHHWHHSRVDHINHNYASMLPVLDRIFGSHYLPPTWPAQYGTETELPASFSGQLLAPFPAPSNSRG